MRRLVLFLLIACLCFGCRKKKNDPAYEYSFGYTLCSAYVGGSVDFTCYITNPNDPTKAVTITPAVTWDFGDGTVTDGGTSISHTYTTDGTYTATMKVNGVVKTASISVAATRLGSTYTAKMAGTREWAGYAEGVSLYFSTPNNYDTIELTVTAMDSSSIDFRGATFTLFKKDPASKTLEYRICSGSTKSILMYYYDKDSIVYIEDWYATVGHGYSKINLHTL